MKHKCAHLDVDGWHVPTQEAAELVRTRARPYSWRDQLRAELSGGVSKWMWPGLLALLLVGVLIHDWLLIIGSVAALGFFMYQAFNLVRTLRAGDLVTVTCRDITRADQPDPGNKPGNKPDKNKPDKKHDDLWCAHVDLRNTTHEVAIICPQCVTALQAHTTLELLVMTDPDDAANNWLVGFREA